jgi:dTDP-4-amino-4,6-dideoxygalactose transaminase
MTRLVKMAAQHGLAVVEDCAQSCGTTWQGQMTGTFGDVGCFSFYPTKNLGAYGDAGLCHTRSAPLAEAIRKIRTYGCNSARSSQDYHAQCEGVNSRLDELQAAILDVKLRHLDDYLAGRRRVACAYQEHLAPQVLRPLIDANVDHSFHLFVIVSEAREQLIARLQNERIGFGIHYPRPIHRMQAYDFLGYLEGSLPETERAAGRILSLPCYPELSSEAVQRICSVVNDVTDPAN